MKPDRSKIGLALLLTALVFSVLTLLYWDFVRNTLVIPLYYLLWVGDLTLKSIPQGAFLAALVVISLVMAVNTLRRLRRTPLTAHLQRSHAPPHSRYRQWRNLYRNLYTSEFTRNLFLSDARRLVLSLIAYEQGVDTLEAEALVKSGAFAVPEAVRKLVERRDIYGLNPPSNRLKIILRRLGLLKPEASINPQLDGMVDEFIRFIEQYREITYDGNRPQS